mmetsp:Transcript_14732/g.22690  ORF Transcript_14732/g.22690 Transcript_14732/m.22690 type:complete len:466 (+) Transcript_14732:77-1474(+)
MTKIPELTIIGGPGTSLPRFAESFFSWVVALSFLGVSGYHYVRTILVLPMLNRLKMVLIGQEHDSLLLELTTSSRSEQTRFTSHHRCQQLILYLQKLSGKNVWSDGEIVQMIRQSDIARRLASLIMITANKAPTSMNNSSPQVTQIEHSSVMVQLRQVWPQLLRLPSRRPPEKYKYEISVIMPAYRESGIEIKRKLAKALEGCRCPQQVEIILVDAGKCEGLNESQKNNGWGNLCILSFTLGGGRGPCLNFGAAHAKGRFLSFVHSDTLLPPDWDFKIIEALDSKKKPFRVSSCAFSFGIDTSLEGLNGSPFPPGIKAIEKTANWRTRLYSLPYGDQVLSLPAVVFHYIGGFPDQCLMEDYEIVALLRRRAALSTGQEKERLVIIGGHPVYCSPRRWQKHGVLYVTFTNSRLVNLYAGHTITPDKLFEHYYRAPPPPRDALAPWEKDLKRKLAVDQLSNSTSEEN